MEKKTIRDLEVKGRIVLVRVDFNVPLKGTVIEDDNRIREAVPTIRYLSEHGARVVLMSHLGRPDGQVKPEFSLAPCAKRLSELMGQEIKMSPEVIGEKTTKLVQSLKDGEIAMLENLRYLPDEEENTESFCKSLAALGNLYVNDAFGTAHRKHASTYGVAKLLPSAIGFLIEKELNMIVKNIEHPIRPFTAVLGGAKVSDKIGIVDSLIQKVDYLIIGGAMAYTFLKAEGYEVGNSLVEEEMLDSAKEFLSKAKEKGVDIFLPLDHVVTNDIQNPKVVKNTKDANIASGLVGADIGKRTQDYFCDVIKKSATVIWNGPMGVFENEQFAAGTKAIAKAMANSHIISIVGGGDSASAVIQFGYGDKMTHISTGGGASLKLFEGKMLPGVEVIADKN